MSNFFKDKKKVTYVVLLILALALVMRVVHFSADPPTLASSSFGLFSDERSKALEARDLVFFNKLAFDFEKLRLDYRFDYLFTVFSDFAMFALFGVGIMQVRIIPLLLGLLSLVLVYSLVKKEINLPVAFMAVMLLAFNYLHIIYSRVGVPYTPMTFLFLLAVIFYFTKRNWGYVLSGIFTLAGFFCSRVGLVFIPILCLGVFLIYLKERELKPLLFFSAGFLVSLLSTVFLYIIPNIPLFIKNHTNLAQYPIFDFSASGLILNSFSVLWADHFFILMSILLPLAFTYILIKTYEPKKISKLNIMLISWILVGLLALSFLNYRATRYFLFLVIPAVVLSAQMMYDILKLKVMKEKLWVSNYQKIIVFVYCFVMSSFFSALLNRLFFNLYSKWLQILVYPVIAFILFFSLGKLYPGIKSFILMHHKKIFAFLLIFYLVFNLCLYSMWVLNPRYDMVNISNDIGKKIPSGALVLSNACGSILEQRIQCIHSVVFANTPEELREFRSKVGYIIASNEEERDKIEEMGLLNGTRLIQTYTFGRGGEIGKIFLYEVIKTKI